MSQTIEPIDRLRLTIAIPTFDRNVILLSNLRRLVPQVKSRTDVEILVIDNASPEDVESSIVGEFGRLPQLVVVRNRFNVGLAGNILKCIEQSRSAWMWLLGDDDTPLDGSVQRILDDVDARSGFLFLNYSNREWTQRVASFDTCGLDELAERMDSFHNFLFISSGVYNLAKLNSGLRHANSFSYTLAPHAALVLAGVGQQGRVYFSAAELVRWGKADAANKWSMIPMSLGIMNLLNLPLQTISNHAYVVLSRKIGSHTLGGRAALANILHYADDFANFAQARYTYHLIAAYRQNVAGWLERFETWFLGWVFCHRRVFASLRWVYLRRKGRAFRSPDRFKRI